MGATNIQVPPQSTGKKVATTERTELHFDNFTGSFTKGDTVTGATSSASAVITAVITEGFPAGEGELYVKDLVGNFQNDENIQVAAVTQAVAKLDVDPEVTLNFQKTVIADPDNPEFLQRIDRFGATVNTFTDGAPTFSPFGAMAVGERQTIKNYTFSFDEQTSLFYDETSGAGSVGYEQISHCSLLSCGTASGDLSKRTSHFYHPYEAGIGTLWIATMRCSDSGKTNVRRRWGYYDDRDGLFWQLDGTTLSVVLRSSVSGSVVDTVINQTDWNNDKLDGTDAIGFDLDPSLANIYWIDFQWLGAGRVRFGVVEPTGEQIVAHTIENTNTSGVTYPYMRTGSLPFRMEQENTGAAGSTSEMRCACASVKHSSESKLSGPKYTTGTSKTITDSDGEVPIMGLRPKLIHKGQANHSIIKLQSLSITNTGDKPLVIRAYAGTDPLLTGSSWVDHDSASLAQEDTSATAINTTLAHDQFTFGVGANSTEFFQDNAPRDLHSIELFPYADSATQPFLYLTAESQSPTAVTCVINAGANWEEIID